MSFPALPENFNRPAEPEKDFSFYDGPAISAPWQMAIRLKVKQPKMPWSDVAKSIGYASVTVYMWTKRPDFQRALAWAVGQELPERSLALEQTRKDAVSRARERFETHAEEMQERLLALADTVDDPKVQKDIATYWLDKVVPTQQTQKARPMVAVISEELLQSFLTRAAEAGLTPSPALIPETVTE